MVTDARHGNAATYKGRGTKPEGMYIECVGVQCNSSMMQAKLILLSIAWESMHYYKKKIVENIVLNLNLGFHVTRSLSHAGQPQVSSYYDMDLTYLHMSSKLCSPGAYSCLRDHSTRSHPLHPCCPMVSAYRNAVSAVFRTAENDVNF
jgi:hypothetical protein